MNFKKLIPFAFLTFLSISLNAQDNRLSYQLNSGISTPILDNGTGIHIGFNPNWMLSDYIGLEGQFSYNYTRLSGTFLSGETGNAQAINTLVGARIYVIPPDKNLRLYFNFLVGGNYFHEKTDSENSDFGLGLSAGTYLTFKKYLLGLGVETNGYWVIKLGYQL